MLLILSVRFDNPRASASTVVNAAPRQHCIAPVTPFLTKVMSSSGTGDLVTYLDLPSLSPIEG